MSRHHSRRKIKLEPTQFSYSLWRWTLAHESLYDLNSDEFTLFALFVALAEKD